MALRHFITREPIDQRRATLWLQKVNKLAVIDGQYHLIRMGVYVPGPNQRLSLYLEPFAGIFFGQLCENFYQFLRIADEVLPAVPRVEATL